MKRDYPGLDIVRFAAAFMVAVYHVGFWWWLPKQSPNAAILKALGGHDSFTRWGWVGVPIFFVLSGFVIAFTADGRLAGQFIKNRALRLYPIAWLCATITLLVAGGTMHSFLNAIFLAPGGPWISGVYWTLSVELAFYLLVTLCVAVGISLPRLAGILAIIGGGYWAARTFDSLIGKPWRPFFVLIETSRFGNLTLLTYGCFFAVGMLLWSINAKRSPRSHYVLILFSISAGILEIFSASRSNMAANGLSGSHLPPILIWFTALLAIVAAVWWNDRLAACLGNGRAMLRTLGLMTYPLYLVHSEVGRKIVLHFIPITSAVIAVSIALAVVMFIAWAILLLEPYPKIALRWVLEAQWRPKMVSKDTGGTRD